ncbi:MAG: hypothetical protein ACKVH8_07855 [Pirellulales bacterium]|jgi:FixJ family two-component response regulator
MDEHRTVYILDDDECACESLAMMVRSLGYQAQRYSSAEEFLSHLQPGVRGCIIADVRMEGISGSIWFSVSPEKGLTFR